MIVSYYNNKEYYNHNITNINGIKQKKKTKEIINS